MRGSPLLEGSNTIPGCHLTSDEKKYFSKILDVCKDYGLDFFPTIVQKLRYDEMSEIAAYDGFPERYPHWYWGMQYEELQRGYEYNRHKIYEMVINSNPCIIYILSSNTLVDNVCVVAHATGHNDFFKNSIHFAPTDQNMVNKLANHGVRIRKYMGRWGREKVTEFIDHILRIQTLIDPAKAWNERKIKNPVIKDTREYEFPRRVNVDKDRLYMYPWLNTKEFIEKEHKRIEKNEAAKELELFEKPERDILGWIKDNAHLKPWQQDIIAMLYEEAMYFSPQRATKVINEGWASHCDYEIMCRQGYVSLGQKTHDCGIVEYAKHKAGVLGGKYSSNPYKLGFYLLLDIEERWNKGQFGEEWDKCEDFDKEKTWDKKLNKGKEKIFETRKYHNDVTFINEFFTEDFCNKFEFFEWKYYPNGEYRIESRDYKKIKAKLIQSKLNGGLPDVRLVDPNHRGKGWILLQHYSDGRMLYEPYARATMASIHHICKKEVALATKDRNGEEVVFICIGDDQDKDVTILTRSEYEESI